MAVQVLSMDGQPVVDGESGELVCKKPFPNMPVCFLDDAQRVKYFSAYFEAIPGKSIRPKAAGPSLCTVTSESKSRLTHLAGVWTHGDFVKMNPKTGGIYILGRR